MTANPKNQIQSAAKIFAVLQAFDAAEAELTLSDIARRTGQDRGTTFRIVHTLGSLGYIASVPDTRRFRLTLKCLNLGYTALAGSDLRVHAQPLLQELVPDLADAASLGVLDGGDVVYVQRIQGDMSRRDLDRRVGTRTGAYAAALGQAILAWHPVERQRERLEMVERVKYSDRTLTDIDALLARLAEVRAQGYAVSDGENAYGMRTIAAPVLNARGEPIAGVSMTVAAERMALEEFLAGTDRILEVAQRLSDAERLSFGAIRVGDSARV